MTDETKKTQLQTAISAAYMAMYESDEYKFGAGGKLIRKVDKLTDEQICALFRYGKRMFNDNYNSMKKEAKDKGKNPATEQAFFDVWFAKLGVSIGTDDSTRGGRLSPQEAGWIAWLNKDIKHKEGGEIISSKTLLRAQRSLCTKAMLKGGVKPEDIQAKLTDENVAAWAAHAEKTEEKLIKRIEAEQPAAAATIVTGWVPN